MKIWTLSILGLFSITPFISFAGGEYTPKGARSLGIGHASAALADEWALYNNIAGIYSTKRPTALAYFQNQYAIPNLNYTGIGFLLPYREVVMGTTFTRFGDEYYNEISAGIGIAHRIRNVSLGLKCNYHQVSIHETGVKRNCILELGGRAEVTEKVFFGASIYNVNQAKINKEKNEYLPVTVKAGIAYAPFKKLIISVETEKQLEFKTIFKSGIEYSIIEKLKLRAGISLHPFTNYFGLGYQDKRISVDYGLSTHHTLGISQQLSLTYIFKKKNEK